MVRVGGDGCGQRLGLGRVGKLGQSLIGVDKIAPARVLTKFRSNPLGTGPPPET
jgi:hypothetical protein